MRLHAVVLASHSDQEGTHVESSTITTMLPPILPRPERERGSLIFVPFLLHDAGRALPAMERSCTARMRGEVHVV